MTPDETVILGGGPAGLGAGYFLRQADAPFRIYEAAERAGGNCMTVQRGDFRFDTGAHRFHDKDPEITEIVKELLGDDLKRVSAPSAIYSHGRFFDFPLSPLNLIRNLGPVNTVRASFAWLKERVKSTASPHFEGHVVKQYGHYLAERFLLNYSEKLWGLPTSRLSTRVSGGRLKGLTLKTFLLEGIRGGRAKTAHLDGTFFYPKDGYGTIADRLAAACGHERVRLGARITEIQHRNNRIEAIVVNGHERIPVARVINTLPLPLFLRMMNPAPAPDILEVAARLKFRDVVLVGLIINKPSLTNYATVYFPDRKYPFTRIYEPRNRSPFMAPPGKTSVMAEIPCAPGAGMSGQELAQRETQVRDLLAEVGWFTASDVERSFTMRLPFAYPMLEAGIEDSVAQLAAYLGTYDNLLLSGRNAQFHYAHLHDMLRWGKNAADEIVRREAFSS